MGGWQLQVGGDLYHLMKSRESERGMFGSRESGSCDLMNGLLGGCKRRGQREGVEGGRSRLMTLLLNPPMGSFCGCISLQLHGRGRGQVGGRQGECSRCEIFPHLYEKSTDPAAAQGDGSLQLLQFQSPSHAPLLIPPSSSL